MSFESSLDSVSDHSRVRWFENICIPFFLSIFGIFYRAFFDRYDE